MAKIQRKFNVELSRDNPYAEHYIDHMVLPKCWSKNTHCKPASLVIVADDGSSSWITCERCYLTLLNEVLQEQSHSVFSLTFRDAYVIINKRV